MCTHWKKRRKKKTKPKCVKKFSSANKLFPPSITVYDLRHNSSLVNLFQDSIPTNLLSNDFVCALPKMFFRCIFWHEHNHLTVVSFCWYFFFGAVVIAISKILNMTHRRKCWFTCAYCVCVFFLRFVSYIIILFFVVVIVVVLRFWSDRLCYFERSPQMFS